MLRKILLGLILIVVGGMSAYADVYVEYRHMMETSKEVAVFMVEADYNFNTADWYAVMYDGQGKAIRIMATSHPEDALKSGDDYFQIVGIPWIVYEDASFIIFYNTIKKDENYRIEMQQLPELR